MFWDSGDIILAYPVPKGTTVTGLQYGNILRDHLLTAIARCRPEKVAMAKAPGNGSDGVVPEDVPIREPGHSRSFRYCRQE